MKLIKTIENYSIKTKENIKVIYKKRLKFKIKRKRKSERGIDIWQKHIKTEDNFSVNTSQAQFEL